MLPGCRCCPCSSFYFTLSCAAFNLHRSLTGAAAACVGRCAFFFLSLSSILSLIQVSWLYSVASLSIILIAPTGHSGRSRSARHSIRVAYKNGFFRPEAQWLPHGMPLHRVRSRCIFPDLFPTIFSLHFDFSFLFLVLNCNLQSCINDNI